MTERALGTWITDRDGAYLSQLLLGEGYEVHVLIWRSSHLGRGSSSSLAWVRGQGAFARRRFV